MTYRVTLYIYLSTKDNLVAVYVCSCYGMALKQQPSVSALWHDLGVCYYHLMKVVEGHSVKLMAGKCVESLKQALALDANSHSHWNVLGVAVAHPGLSFLRVNCILSMLRCHLTNLSDALCNVWYVAFCTHYLGMWLMWLGRLAYANRIPFEHFIGAIYFGTNQRNICD